MRNFCDSHWSRRALRNLSTLLKHTVKTKATGSVTAAKPGTHLPPLLAQIPSTSGRPPVRTGHEHLVRVPYNTVMATFFHSNSDISPAAALLMSALGGRERSSITADDFATGPSPGLHRSPVTDQLWDARKGDNFDGPPQTKLLTRKPSESSTEVVYKFSQDEALRDMYRNPWNYVRFGRILEDLDSMAGTIAHKHCLDDNETTRPLLLVTASVDKISMRKPLRLDVDMTLAGAVMWVGRSSMEIRVIVLQASPEDPQASPVALESRFNFVARDAKTNKAAPVNRLEPETEEERAMFRDGEARDAARKAVRAQQAAAGLQTHPKSAATDARLKALLEEGRIMCEMPALADRDSILISDTQLEYALICQPQHRNTNGRIFGGFLMRRAFELAFSTCYVFCGSRPQFLETDHVDFWRPVDIGDLLRFKANILYTEQQGPQPRMHVEVVAYVTQPELRKSEVSNTFYFTFTVDPETLGGKHAVVRRVVPSTEVQARSVINRYDADHPSSSIAPAQ